MRRGGRWSVVLAAAGAVAFSAQASSAPVVVEEDVRRVVAAAQGSVCLPSTHARHLSTVFDAEPGHVVGADYQRAYPLGDGRVLWMFQDGAIRRSDDSIAIVHSIAMLQDGRCFDVLYGGTRDAPRPFLFADATVPFERWFWPLDAELGDDGLLYVFAVQMVERGSAYLTRTEPVGTHVAVIDPSTLRVVSETRPANRSADLYGWSITSDERWTYLYAQCYRQFGFDLYIFTEAYDRSCAARVTVARVPRGRLLDEPGYWDGRSWQSDHTRAVPVIQTAGRRINADQIEFTGSSFFSVNKEGDWWGDTIYFSRAESAQGPFVVYDTIPAPVKCDECNSFFATWIPPDAADRPLATFVIGLSHNRWSGRISAQYRPTYHVVPAPPQVAGGDSIRADVGASGAVVLNLTSTRSTDRGYVVASSCDAETPRASSLNHGAGVTAGSLVVVRTDGSDEACVFGRATGDLVADRFGVFPEGSELRTLDRPRRLFDSRDDVRLRAGQVLRLGIEGGWDAIAATVTVVDPDADGYVTASPCDRERPLASTVNAPAGSVVGNLTFVRLSPSGELCLFAKSGTDLVVDLVGGFRGTTDFTPADVPERLLDTREHSRPEAGSTTTFTLPPGARAGVINLTAVDPSDDGHVTAWPCDRRRPTTSSLNVRAGVTRGNLAVVRPGANGRVCLVATTSADLVVDLAGVMGSDSTFEPDPIPVRVLDTRIGLGVVI